MKPAFKNLLVCIFVWALVSCSADSYAENTELTETSFIQNVAGNPLVIKYSYNDLELETLQLVNEYRKSIGLNELQKADFISTLSKEHNEEMISTKTFNHNGFSDRSKSIMKTLSARLVAENLAYNYKSPKATVQAWINSPDHKANLEGDFTHFGIAVTLDAQTGKTYYTNIFAKL
ncbi:CAP domain-containing protein [Flavobacterium agrisoli]|uniref:CAP domain-containing protein n=1 Tax=Flavobacterium agrisoli TaxID=2793066 RepID=A0A934PM63_9FLAO|nr:CAP domain-containing protein [Flavobacterium agrisoli]MBK0368923.1 CAP domain-containing protein [Flavobacterium agrisoli]